MIRYQNRTSKSIYLNHNTREIKIRTVRPQIRIQLQSQSSLWQARAVPVAVTLLPESRDQQSQVRIKTDYPSPVINVQKYGSKQTTRVQRSLSTRRKDPPCIGIRRESKVSSYRTSVKFKKAWNPFSCMRPGYPSVPDARIWYYAQFLANLRAVSHMYVDSTAYECRSNLAQIVADMQGICRVQTNV